MAPVKLQFQFTTASYIDSDGTDLSGDLMTTISAHRGLYSVVHEINEGVNVLV